MDQQGGGTAAAPHAGQVYMGEKPSIRLEGRGYYTPPGGTYLPKNDAYEFISSLSGKQLADLQSRMIYGGLIKEGDGLIEMKAKWKSLVDVAQGFSRVGQKVTPMDVLSSYLGQGPLGGKGGVGATTGASVWQTQWRSGRKFLVNTQTGEVKYQGPRFETTYNKSLDLTDPTTAKAIATTMFQQLMHRDPAKGEMASFAGALRAAEEASPVLTNTTVEYDMNTGEPIGQSSTSTGGFSADAKQYLAEQQIKKNKEYGAIQASTTYRNALENAVFNNPYGSL